MSDAETITVQVTPEAARAFRAASEEERRKMEALISLRLLEVARPRKPLEDIMREISRSARQRGLTEETLDEILKD